MWWSGAGLLGLIIPGATGTAGYFLLSHHIGIGFGIIVGGILTWFAARGLDAEEEGSAGSMIPLEYWSVLTCIVGVVLVVADIVHAIRR